MKHIFFCLVHAAALSLAAPAFASPFYPTEAAVFFSPNGGAEDAIVRSIDSAKSRIRMQAFLFSNKEITGALIRAHQRGVKVDVIIDKKMPKKKPNTTEDLIEAGVPTFFDTAHRTAHDKIIIVDDDIVLTGSFNFVKVAETKNGENLLILKSKPLAEEYVKNWEKHFTHSVPAAPEKRERHRSASHKNSKLTHQLVDLDDVLLIKREEVS